MTIEGVNASLSRTTWPQCGVVRRTAVWNREACSFEESGEKESLHDPKQISQ